MANRILIIGSGISGLSAGIYLQMNGYESEIFEQHYLPGGVCTGWFKQGYYIDGCIHWLMGTKPGTGYHGMWQELKAFEETPLLQPHAFSTIHLSNGEVFTITRDFERFIRDLMAIAPEDRAAIDELAEALRRMARAEVFFEKPREIANLLDGLQTLRQLGPALKVYGRFSKLTVEEWVGGLKSPLLAEILQDIVGIGAFSAISVLTTLNLFFTGNGGIPQGGSLAFAKRLAKRYQALGGKLHLNQPVQRIVLEGQRATGLELADGSVVQADRVVSAADGHVTYQKLLGERSMAPKLQAFYRETPPFKPLIIVS